MGVSRKGRKPLQELNVAKEANLAERASQPLGKDSSASPLQELHAVNMTLAQTMRQIDSLLLRAHKLGMRGQLAPDEIRHFATALQDVQSSMDEWSTFLDSATTRAVTSPRAQQQAQKQIPSIPMPSSSPDLLATPSPLSNGQSPFLFLPSAIKAQATTSADLASPSKTPASGLEAEPSSGRSSMPLEVEDGCLVTDVNNGAAQSAGHLQHQAQQQEQSRPATPAPSDPDASSPLPPTPNFSSPLQTVQALQSEGQKQSFGSSLLMSMEATILTGEGTKRHLAERPDASHSHQNSHRQLAMGQSDNDCAPGRQFSTPPTISPVFELSPPATCQQLKLCWSSDGKEARGPVLLPASPFHTPGVRLKRAAGDDSPTPPEGQQLLVPQPNFRAPIALTPAGMRAIANASFASISAVAVPESAPSQIAHGGAIGLPATSGAGAAGMVRMRSLDLLPDVEALSFGYRGVHQTGDRTWEAQACRELQIADFPSFFQTGDAKKQLETVYDQFVPRNMVHYGCTASNELPPQAMADLSRRLPRLGEERLALLLELLTSRGYLTRLVQGGQQMWTFLPRRNSTR